MSKVVALSDLSFEEAARASSAHAPSRDSCLLNGSRSPFCFFSLSLPCAVHHGSGSRLCSRPVGSAGQERCGRAEESGDWRGPRLSHHGRRPLFLHRRTARQIPPSRHGDRLCFSIRRYRRFHQPNHHSELHAANRTGVHHRQRPGGCGAAARCLRSLAGRHLQRDRGRHASQPQPRYQQSGGSCLRGHADLQSARRAVHHHQWRQAGQINANGGRSKSTSTQLDYTDANDWEFGGSRSQPNPRPTCSASSSPHQQLGRGVRR